MGEIYDMATGFQVDDETGEIIKRPTKSNKILNNTDHPVPVMLEPGQECSIRKAHKPLKKAKGEPFIMVFQQGLQRLILDGQLNNDERAVLFTVAQFVTFDGRIEVPDEYSHPRPLIQKDLYALMGWSEKSKGTLTKVLNSLESKGLILRVKEGRATYIEINPGHFFVGKMQAREKRVQAYNFKALSFLKEGA